MARGIFDRGAPAKQEKKQSTSSHSNYDSNLFQISHDDDQHAAGAVKEHRISFFSDLPITEFTLAARSNEEVEHYVKFVSMPPALRPGLTVRS